MPALHLTPKAQPARHLSDNSIFTKVTLCRFLIIYYFLFAIHILLQKTPVPFIMFYLLIVCLMTLSVTEASWDSADGIATGYGLDVGEV
jgi:hypothetical protein